VKTPKVKKPYPEYPLFAHASNQWAKKIKGRMWYFGTLDDHVAALDKYNEQIHDIQAGRDPRRTKKQISAAELSVHDMANLFLARQEARIQTGEVGRRHFSDCFQSCKLLTDYFGTFQSASTLKAADFQAFRASFPATWGATKVSGEISRVKAAFKWAFESDLINALPKFGPDFKRSSGSVTRRDQQQRQAERGGKLDFSAKEIQKLLKASDGWLHACILLGINGGMGNADCGRLSTKFLDLKSGWYDLPRHKTGVDRRFQLWPETIKAIREAMMERPIAKNDAHQDLCFLTSRGMPIWFESSNTKSSGFRDSVSKAFTALCSTCGVARSQRGFYSLRRTFETVAGDSKDQVAVDVVMGHCDQSMAAKYRQGIEDQRLIDVGQHVRNWLFPPKAKKKPAKRAKKAAKKASSK
jgi:integrase